MNGRRRPVGGTSGQPVGGWLAIVIDAIGLLRESRSILQAINIDHDAGSRSGLADCADINPTALADQKIGGACPKAVVLDQRPVCGVDIDRAIGIAGRARIVGAAERTTTRPQSRFSRWLRKAQGETEIATVTTAAMFNQPFSPLRVPRLPRIL